MEIKQQTPQRPPWNPGRWNPIASLFCCLERDEIQISRVGVTEAELTPAKKQVPLSRHNRGQGYPSNKTWQDASSGVTLSAQRSWGGGVFSVQCSLLLPPMISGSPSQEAQTPLFS